MLEDIKKLRTVTSLGINECQKALKESEGDFDKALAILKKRGVSLIAKKKDRQASQGLIEAYVHFGGNLGALVEVNCETDFVARTEVFKKFAKDVAMQVAAANPTYINQEDIPEEELSGVKDPKGFVKESCLLEQPFIKESKMTMKEYLQEVVSQTGENVVVRRFVKFSLGEEHEGSV